jgi:hypothetical protein
VKAKQNVNEIPAMKEVRNVAKEAGTVAKTKEDKNEALPNHRQGFFKDVK